MTTASVPISIEVGLSQLVMWLPAALPAGTRSDAIPPTTAPSKNGVRIDESEKAVSTAPDGRRDRAPEWSAYAVPRKTIPTAATKSGIESVEAIDPNASGYAVQTTVSTNTSQTWFASHTGPIAR